MNKEKLIEVTTKLGKTYDKSDKAKKSLEAERLEFFEAATASVAQKKLAQKTVRVEKDIDSEAYVQRWHPGWRIVNETKQGVIIEEDPAHQAFTFVNPKDGKVYARQTSQRQPQLDDELLQEEDPDLWQEITEWANANTMRALVDECMIIRCDPEGIEQIVDTWATVCGAQRVLKPLEDLNVEQRDKMAKYIVPSAITLKLAQPRKAKPEELEDVS